MKQNLRCEICDEIIEYNYDLVVALSFFGLKCYHNECYIREIKKLSSSILSGPYNTKGSTLYAVIWTTMFAIFYFKYHNVNSLLSIFLIICAIIPISLRSYSYYKYEKKLK
ncbi:hypothetical protein PV797_19570 [Clostridiaceae bacterium M8S5]|nr:hypothetical protein PV797_19570 [Clostridiaceae bacterium M8S5]